MTPTPGFHKRSHIRTKVVELLKKYVDVGERVYASRPEPIWEDEELPICLVYFADEPADTKGRRPRNYERTLAMNVDILSQPGQVDLDTWLDDRAYETELAMLADETLHGLVFDVLLVRTRPVVYEYESSSNKAIIRLQFAITYETEVYTTATCEEFLRFHNTIQTTDGAETEDHVTIREE